MKKIITLLVLININLFAVDTIETFDLGFTDFEYYHKTSNLSEDNKIFTNEIHIGMGITSIFSAHVGISSEKFSSNTAITSNSFGFIFTPLDTTHVDIDFYGELDNSYNSLIGLELNYDLKDDLQLAGFYLDSELNFNNGYNGYSFLFGSYYSLLDNLQLLIQLDISKNNNENLNIGALAFGANYQLYDTIELITEFSIDIPQNDEKTGYSVMLGFLATLP